MTKIGFGGYRIIHRSEDHRAAVKLAIANGVRLFDTSANYTDGESEILIGEEIKAYPREEFLIVSKVGYIQGQNLEVHAEKKFPEVVDFGDDLKHCLHPDFIEDQIQRSLKRLQVDYLDIYLLHNPEYYLKSEGSDKQEYYRRIRCAFEKMEELVERGLIISYGISSNTLVDPKQEHTATDLDVVLGSARDIQVDHHFKYIQFPFNILEMGAIERQYDGDHLFERAAKLGLKTMINRPLNSFTEQGLLRLATYPVDAKYSDAKYAEEVFHQCIQPLVVKWLEVRESEQDKLFDIPLMKQIAQIWYQQPSRDAVDQVFYQYFYPFVAQVWGGDLSVQESQKFYDLHEHAFSFARANMNARASQFETQAINKGLLRESEAPLTHKVIEKYQMFGMDYILVGMKDPAYVTDLSTYF